MRDVVRILGGPLVWLAAFSAVYGLHGVACAYGWGEVGVAGTSLLRVALVGAWFCAIAAQVAVLAGLYSRRLGSPSGFVRGVSRMTAWVGLVSTLWSLFPVATTSSCA
jgi:hypothetical protein